MPYLVRFSCCCNGDRGGSRIFFRRGCTRLELNKPHSFFWQNTSCIRKLQVISGRVEGAHPLQPPPRSAPELSGMIWTQPYSKETSAPAYLRTALFFKLSGVTSMYYYCTSSKRSLILQVRVPKTCTCQILLNESETCTVMKAMEKKLDGCYIKMLRMVFNVSWQNKLTNKDYMVICHQCHQRWVSEGWS